MSRLDLHSGNSHPLLNIGIPRYTILPIFNEIRDNFSLSISVVSANGESPKASAPQLSKLVRKEGVKAGNFCTVCFCHCDGSMRIAN